MNIGDKYMSYKPLDWSYVNLKKISKKIGAENILKEITWLIKPYLYNYTFSAIYVEPTNACNYECIMCHHKNLKRKQGFMSFDLYKKVVQEALDNNVKIIRLSVFGEPLLHPNFIDMINYAERRGMSIDFFSNASLLDSKKSRELLKTKIKNYIFSFEGATKQTYEKVMKGGNFERSIKNIEEFLRIRKELKSKAFVTIYSLYMSETSNEINKLIEMWKNKVDAIGISKTIDYAGKVEKRFDQSLHKRRFPCVSLWDNPVILWNGDVTVCCVDFEGELVVGNIKNQSLKKIWRGSEIGNLRKIHINRDFRKIPICYKCNSYLLIEDEVEYFYNPKYKTKYSKGELIFK